MFNLDLVVKAQQGNSDAFAQLYLAYKDSLYRYAWYKIGNPIDASDAVADTVLTAFEQIRKLKNPKAFSTYLFSIHNATCAKYTKAVITSKNNKEFEPNENFSVPTSDDFEAIELREALEKLDTTERDIVLLSVSGFNSKEIAKITGFTSGAVRSKLSRTYSKMRAYLEN